MFYPASKTMTYRPDIDGLRAIAVLSVIFFHANFSLFSGGFTGVDIFFVISGFLITGIIVDDLRNQKFSFANFYRRRILRIFPALIVVVFFTLVAGYFFLLPSDYVNLGRSALCALLFSANFYFLSNTGYFHQDADMQPLLHTWSLGVEEQFYIVWPLFVIFLYRAFRREGRGYWWIIAAFVAVSFGYNLFYSYNSESRAFYVPVARAWELLAGAAVYSLSVRADALKSLVGKLAALIPWVGLVLLCLSIFYLTRQNIFPGFAVILPVTGAAMLILAGSLVRNPVNTLLATPLPVFFGKISYSLYLWHWPIFTYYHHYIGEEKRLSLMEASCLIIVTCVVSAISWKTVEQPARRLTISNGRSFVLGGAATVAAAAVSLVILTSAGFRNRFPEHLWSMMDRDVMTQWNCAETLPLQVINSAYQETGRRKKKVCVLGAPWQNSTRKAVLWGDSHAGHFVQLLDYVAKQNNISIAHYAGCPPYVDNERIMKRDRDPKYSENCADGRKAILHFLETSENIDLVILASIWSAHYKRMHEPGKRPNPERGLELMRSGMEETLARINPAKIPVLLISDVPGVGREMTACVVAKQTKLPFKKCGYEVISRNISELKYHRQSNGVLAELAGHNKGVYLINSVDKLCDERKCDNYINNEFIYRDSHHLRLNLSPDTVVEMARRLGLAEEVGFALKADKAGPAVTLAGDGGGQK